MADNVFQITKDFYTLKAEYEMNMQQIQRVNQELRREVDRLTKSFNELRDVVAKHLTKKQH